MRLSRTASVRHREQPLYLAIQPAENDPTLRRTRDRESSELLAAHRERLVRGGTPRFEERELLQQLRLAQGQERALAQLLGKGRGGLDQFVVEGRCPRGAWDDLALVVVAQPALEHLTRSVAHARRRQREKCRAEGGVDGAAAPAASAAPAAPAASAAIELAITHPPHRGCNAGVAGSSSTTTTPSTPSAPSALGASSAASAFAIRQAASHSILFKYGHDGGRE